MVKIEIVESLYLEIEKKFKGEGHKILDLMYSLESSPQKGEDIRDCRRNSHKRT
jgi:hypothetical protein